MAGTVNNLYHQVSLNRFIKRSGRKFMLMQHSFQGGFGVFSLYMFTQIVVHGIKISPVIGGLLVAGFVMLFTAATELSHNLRRKLKNDFPEVFQIAT